MTVYLGSENDARGLVVPQFIAPSSPTFFQNTASTASKGSGLDSVPNSMMTVSVSSDGYPVTGTTWAENQRECHIYDPATGEVFGPATNTRIQQTGAIGCAVDPTYVYYASAGTVIRSSRASWLTAAERSAYDNGGNSGVAPLSIIGTVAKTTAGLSVGAVTTIVCSAWPLGTIAPGTTLTIVDPTGAHTDTLACPAGAAFSAGTIAVTGTLSFAYPSGSEVYISIRDDMFHSLALSGGYLYAVDLQTASVPGQVPVVGSASSVIWKIGPLTSGSWGTATQLLTIPYARRIRFDRHGFLWILSQQVASPATAAQLTCYDVSSTPSQIHQFSPDAGYAMGFDTDPAADQIYVADNGQDQNIKVYSYTSGTHTGTIGPVGGYLDNVTDTKGKLGPVRLCGPRDVACDASGNLFIVQSPMIQTLGQGAWNDNAPACILSKLGSDHATEAWRVWQSGFGDVGVPTSDWSKFYGWFLTYDNKNGSTPFKPRACTMDPYTYTYDPRISPAHGASGKFYTLNGRTYWVNCDPPSYAGLEIYLVSGEILIPLVKFNNNSTITTNGTVVNVSSNPSLASTNVTQDWWMDDSGNVWAWGRSATGGLQSQLHWRYNLQGFDGGGTPLYDFAHVDTFPTPSWSGGDLQSHSPRGEVHGSSVYMTGWSLSNPWLSSANDAGKKLGYIMAKFPSLPTPNPSGSWPTPTWTIALSYDQTTGHYPICFTVAPDKGKIAVGWIYGTGSPLQGMIQVYSDADGSLLQTLDPPVSSTLGVIGFFDMLRAIQYANGWIWFEDDWNQKTVGLSL